ncbi:MAG TPA: antibiotic biosynthesis monooxygenase [Methylomirabilota bacterium]|nr:antibiotic biosynthesis monooxygenase [Methylomirabilota bacterium]
MIMRITWGKLRPGSWNEFERTYNTTVAAKGRAMKGLRGRWLLQDAADKDTGFAVSLWETAGDMHAYEQSALYTKEFAPALQPFFVGDYKTYRCDVKYMQ